MAIETHNRTPHGSTQSVPASRSHRRADRSAAAGSPPRRGLIDYPRAGRTGLLRWVPSWQLVAGATAAGILLVLAGVGTAYALASVPDPNRLAVSQSTVIQWSDGSEIGRFGAQNRISVPLANIPPHVRYAVLSAEDRTFYENRGVSVTGVTRAFWNNLRGGGVQGGSTITQQYAKNAFLTQEQTFTRKFKELFIALKLNKERTKDEVLANYLNTIYFGRGAYGIQTAAQTYFGKDVSQITVSEGALLAGIIQQPSAYDPAKNPESIMTRWSYVLDGMVEQEWLDPQDREAQQFPAVLPPSRGNQYSGPQGYLIQTVLDELKGLGYSEQQIEIGGLLVKTTFDQKLQDFAEKAVTQNQPANAPPQLHTAMVSLRPGTGEIVAMYGGRDYTKQFFNHAMQGRISVGSTFKPFALAAALENGIGLRSNFDGDSPQQFDGFPEKVENEDDKSYGTVDLLKATMLSVNTAYVALGLEVGPDKVLDVATRLGIPKDTPDLNANPSIVLGVSTPRVVDLANAYGTIAAVGKRATPHTVAEIRKPNGGLAYKARNSGEQVIREDVIADVTYAMQQVIDQGTGRVAKALGRPAAGKTGTGEYNKSAWFAGFTPQLSTAVAMFGEDASTDPPQEIPLRDLTGNRVNGGSNPAQIWTQYMRDALKGQQALRLPKPANVGKTLNPLYTPPPKPSPTPTPVQQSDPVPSKTKGKSDDKSPKQSPTPSTSLPSLPFTSPPTGTRPPRPPRTSQSCQPGQVGCPTDEPAPLPIGQG